MSRIDKIILSKGFPWCATLLGGGVWAGGIALAKYGLGFGSLGAASLVSGLAAIAVFSAVLDRGVCQSLH